jgi:hypothetical protein
MSAAEHLREAIDVGCTRDDHDHVADHRAEVLREAADFIDSSGTDFPVAVRNGVEWAVRTLRRMAEEPANGKDTGGAPAGESTQPASVQVWHVFEEDTHPAVPPLFASQRAAEDETIARYQEMEGSCPDYSWRPHEDGSHELVAGGEPVGIYLAPVTVASEPADRLAPYVQPVGPGDGGLTAAELLRTPKGTAYCARPGCGHGDNVHGPFCFASGCGCADWSWGEKGGRRG